MSEAAAPDPRPALERTRQSYRQILRVAAVMGSSAALETGIGLVRTKVLAVLLGPAGYGLMGSYGLIGEITRSLAQLGINASGVRQIAAADASGDTARLARTAAVLRRASLGCALLGALGLMALAGPVATLTFGDTTHRDGILLLSVAVFLTLLASGRIALLQGLRRIDALARLAVLGSLLGATAGIPIVYVWGEQGIVPTLVIVAAGSVAAAWWYSRGLVHDAASTDARGMLRETGALLRLGIAFMGSGLLMSGATYAVRVIVMRHDGLAGAGVYQAAAALAALSTAFVLQALGTDFYPRLVGVAADHPACNRLVDEQTRVGMLLAAPGLVATIAFASIAVELFYSARFAAAAEVVRWICLGMALRILVWPAGTIVIAQNRQALFVGIELAWASVNVAASLWCVAQLGVAGAGIAFFVAYAVHAGVVLVVAHSLSGFRWSAGTLRTAAGCLAFIAATFIVFAGLPPHAALAVGATGTVLCTWLCGRALVKLAAPRALPPLVRRLLGLRAEAAA